MSLKVYPCDNCNLPGREVFVCDFCNQEVCANCVQTHTEDEVTGDWCGVCIEEDTFS
mgnify:CR=1 FL=1